MQWFHLRSSNSNLSWPNWWDGTKSRGSQTRWGWSYTNVQRTWSQFFHTRRNKVLFYLPNFPSRFWVFYLNSSGQLNSRNSTELCSFKDHPFLDNIIKDFYGRWSIEAACDSITLESAHPLLPPITTFGLNDLLLYTNECNNDEIAYFKVDVNLIEKLPWAYLGNIWNSNNENNYDYNHN